MIKATSKVCFKFRIRFNLPVMRRWFASRAQLLSSDPATVSNALILAKSEDKSARSKRG
jgi:hypothetical protein